MKPNAIALVIATAGAIVPSIIWGPGVLTIAGGFVLAVFVGVVGGVSSVRKEQNARRERLAPGMSDSEYHAWRWEQMAGYPQVIRQIGELILSDSIKQLPNTQRMHAYEQHDLLQQSMPIIANQIRRVQEKKLNPIASEEVWLSCLEKLEEARNFKRDLENALSSQTSKSA